MKSISAVCGAVLAALLMMPGNGAVRQSANAQSPGAIGRMMMVGPVNVGWKSGGDIVRV